MLRAPLTINDSGRGAAIWAPFRLWSLWRPGTTGFQGELLTGFDFFHGNLMARGATLAVRPRNEAAREDIVPAPVNLPEGQTRFPEVINRARDVTFVNHDAPGQPAQLASIETVGVGDWLWSGGLTQLPNALPGGLTGGRPAPIDNPEPLASRLRPLNLYATLAPGEMKTLHMEPVSAQNLGGGPLCAQILSHSNTGLELNVWAQRPAHSARERRWRMAAGARDGGQFSHFRLLVAKRAETDVRRAATRFDHFL